MCDTEAPTAAGLVQFLPRPSDVAWRERAAEQGFVGQAPDSAWFCAAHLGDARTLAPLVDIELGLSQLRSAALQGDAAVDDHEVAAPGGRASEDGMEMGAWVRVLRRAMPDLAVEAGCADIVVENHAQETYYPMDGSPPEVSPFTWTEAWTVSDDGATVCLYTETARWNTDEIARVEGVIMVTPSADEARRYVVKAMSPVGSTRIGPEHVVLEGEPSPAMRDLLETHGLWQRDQGEAP